MALLRGMKRGLDFLRSNKEKVAAAVIKKGIFWRSCNDTQDNLPVFRRVLSANH